MFFNHLKDDSYFKTLFQKIPKTCVLEIAQVDADLQRNILRLTFHSSLVPDSSGEFNHSTFVIDYMFPKNLCLSLPDPTTQLCEFHFDETSLKIEGNANHQKLLSFSYTQVKLKSWELYFRES